MPEVLKHFRVVRYDRRGHGKSGVPAGPYNMEMLGRDALAVLDTQVWMTGADPAPFADVAGRAQVFAVSPGRVSPAS